MRVLRMRLGLVAVVGPWICIRSVSVLLLASGCMHVLCWLRSSLFCCFNRNQFCSVFTLPFVVSLLDEACTFAVTVFLRKCRSKSSPVIIASSDGLFALMFLSFQIITSSSEIVNPSLSSSKSLLLPSSVFGLSILLRLRTLFVSPSCFGFSCVLLLVLVSPSATACSGDCAQWVTKGQCSLGNKCGMRDDPEKRTDPRGEGKGSRPSSSQRQNSLEREQKVRQEGKNSQHAPPWKKEIVQKGMPVIPPDGLLSP